MDVISLVLFYSIHPLHRFKSSEWLRRRSHDMDYFRRCSFLEIKDVKDFSRPLKHLFKWQLFWISICRHFSKTKKNKNKNKKKKKKQPTKQTNKNKTKQNKKQKQKQKQKNRPKQSKTKQNKTKNKKTKQNKTKQNKK